MRADFTLTREQLLSAGPMGSALGSGRLVCTVTGSDGHITIKMQCKMRSASGKFVQCAFGNAELVDVSVPGAGGEWADRIGTAYTAHGGNRWAGVMFRDRAQTDDRRWAAAQYVLAVLGGKASGDHVVKSEHCLRCMAELRTPESIASGFGSECADAVGAFHAGNGAHEQKVKTPERVTVPDDADRPAATLKPQPAARIVVPEPEQVTLFTLREGDDPRVILNAVKGD